MHHNSIELLGYYGGDETHALSAWTSTSRELQVPENGGGTKRDRIPKLLKSLASAGHETPFEKSTLHFLVTMDIASHIHLIKHRIGVSVNAESARYKELKDDKFYLPADWTPDAKAALTHHMEESFDLYHYWMKKLIGGGMDRKRAKESCRYFLPYANQIVCDVAFNWRSFVAFQRLRNEEHAQSEIRHIAAAMLSVVRNIPSQPFEHSLAAFGL